MNLQTGLTIEAVRLVAERIEGAVAGTPFVHLQTPSQPTGADVRLKFDNLGCTASFKPGAALSRLLHPGGDERARGVVVVSAGNHAQGVACHGQRLGVASACHGQRLGMPVTMAQRHPAHLHSHSVRLALFA